MKIVVVGGGIAGLAVAQGLAGHGNAVVLLESRPKTGGRVRSVYANHSPRNRKAARSLLYEAGPWRVPETHMRVRTLFARMGVALRPLTTPTLPPTPQAEAADEENGPETTTGSLWDSNALATEDPLTADKRDLATGYADQTRAAAGTNPYVTHAKRYYVAEEGFSEVVERMMTDVAHRKDVTVKTNCRVVDVKVQGRRTYAVAFLQRTTETSNDFLSGTLHADAVFVCVPPSQCKEWTVLHTCARSQMCAVVEGCLNHVYVPYDDAALPSATPPYFHMRNSRSLLGQSVGDQYDSGYFQATYTSGRLARMWYLLRLSDPRAYLTRLATQVWRWTGIDLRPLRHARSHFWERAYHYWRPVPHFDLSSSVKRAVRPNPTRLPFFYVAGEAFSSYQAWMEGALETAELALRAFHEDRTRPPPPPRTTPATPMELQGHVLDVGRWAAVHPGSAKAILSHAKEDVTQLFEHIGHSDFAWAVAYSLQARG